MAGVLWCVLLWQERAVAQQHTLSSHSAFLEWDTNNDGKLTPAEYKEAVLNNIAGQGNVQGDTKTQLSDEQLAGITHALFERSDKDKNGEITREEWVSTVQLHQKVAHETQHVSSTGLHLIPHDAL